MQGSLYDRFKEVFSKTDKIDLAIDNSVVFKVSDDNEKNLRFTVNDGSSEFIVTENLVCVVKISTVSTEDMAMLNKIVNDLNNLI